MSFNILPLLKFRVKPANKQGIGYKLLADKLILIKSRTP
jgi:hypothetical protein